MALFIEMAAANKDNSVEHITQRGRIIGEWEHGVPTRDIAVNVGVSTRTVQRWISRWREEGTLANRPRRGRPHVTTRQQDEQIIAAAINDPLKTSVSITQELHLPCTPQTTRQRLKNHGIRCHVPAVKEELKEWHRDTRLGFALQHLVYDIDYWKNVIFSDETYFTSIESRAMHVWRRIGTRYDARNIQERARSGRVGVSYWGWMSSYGSGELVRVDGTLNGREYIQILENVMLPTVRAMMIPEPEPFIFVQDKSRIHTSHVVTEWFRRHPEIQVMDWPVKGCDMNPIENLWGIMKKEIQIGPERTCRAIDRAVREVWESVRRRPNICKRLVTSMPNRMNEVIDARGGWTHY